MQCSYSCMGGSDAFTLSVRLLTRTTDGMKQTAGHKQTTLVSLLSLEGSGVSVCKFSTTDVAAERKRKALWLISRCKFFLSFSVLVGVGVGVALIVSLCSSGWLETHFVARTASALVRELRLWHELPQSCHTWRHMFWILFQSETSCIGNHKCLNTHWLV